MQEIHMMQDLKQKQMRFQHKRKSFAEHNFEFRLQAAQKASTEIISKQYISKQSLRDTSIDSISTIKTPRNIDISVSGEKLTHSHILIPISEERVIKQPKLDLQIMKQNTRFLSRMSGLHSKLETPSPSPRPTDSKLSPRHALLSRSRYNMETPFRDMDFDLNGSPIPGFTVYSPNLQ
jgi:hypothetical protein